MSLNFIASTQLIAKTGLKTQDVFAIKASVIKDGCTANQEEFIFLLGKNRSRKFLLKKR